MTTLLLMGHGSRDSEGMVEFLQLVDAVQAAAPRNHVTAGWLEFAGAGMPTIQEAIGHCVAQGERTVLAVPVLLHRAGHSRHDMPAEIMHARARFPQLDLRSADYLETYPGLLEIVEERIHTLERALASFDGPPTDDLPTAILLVGRGSSDSEANADFFKLGRLLWERDNRRYVECCFVSLTRPDVPDGIGRCIGLGAQRVLVIPYFVNTGVLVKRIAEQADAVRPRFPNVEIAVSEHLGVHPRLIEAILARARALEMADVPPVRAVSGVG